MKIKLNKGTKNAAWFLGGGITALVGERLIGKALDRFFPYNFAGFEFNDVFEDDDETDSEEE